MFRGSAKTGQFAVRIVLLLLALAAPAAYVGCGGGGGAGGGAGVVSDTPAAAGPDISVPDPGAPELVDAPAVVSLPRPPGNPPPDGASADGTINTYYVPANAFDGNFNTWWVGEIGRNEWDLYYGFTSVRRVDRIGINFYSTSHTPAQVVLKTSADGANWTTVGQFPAGNANPWLTVNADIRYIWIQMDGNPAINYPLIRDVTWLPNPDRDGALAGPGVNDYHYKAANAFDGDPNTWWVGAVSAGSWDMYYKFASPTAVQMFTATFFNINYRPTTLSMSISNDGSNWTSLGPLGPGAAPSIYIGQTTTYLKLEMSGNPPSTYPLITDTSFALPLGGSSDDSINAFYTAANAFDGNTATWWTGAQSQTEWNLYYKFATPTAVSAVTIDYYAQTHAPATTSVYISADGINWTTSGIDRPAADDVSIPVGTSTQYLRFQLTGVPSVGYPLIRDITLSNQVDVVWVLDQTGSMGPNLMNVSAAIPTLFANMQARGYDVRMGAVGFNAGVAPLPVAVPMGTPQDTISPSGSQSLQTSAAAVAADVNVIASALGGARERGLDAMMEALNFTGIGAQMVARPNARRVIILITDADSDDNGEFGADPGPNTTPAQRDAVVNELHSWNAACLAVNTIIEGAVPYPGFGIDLDYEDVAIRTDGVPIDLDPGAYWMTVISMALDGI